MGHYCEPASCWSNDNKLKKPPKLPLDEIPNKFYACDMEEVASVRGGKTSLKSRLIRDCVHFILTRNSYKIMEMLWASPNIFAGTIMDLYWVWILESREQWRSEHKPRQQSPAHSRCKPGPVLARSPGRRAGGCR